jgi:hypothetical protein
MSDGVLADGEGFEPPDPFGSTVFKTAALNRSATHPLPTLRAVSMGYGRRRL